MVRGEAWQTSSSGDFPLRPWQVVVLPRGTWHGFRDCVRCEVLDCCIGIEVLRRELAWTREDPVLGPVIHALAPAPDIRPVLHHLQLTPAAGGRILAVAAGLAEALRERPARSARPGCSHHHRGAGCIGSGTAGGEPAPSSPDASAPGAQAAPPPGRGSGAAMDVVRAFSPPGHRPLTSGACGLARHRCASHGPSRPSARAERRRPICSNQPPGRSTALPKRSGGRKPSTLPGVSAAISA